MNKSSIKIIFFFQLTVIFLMALGFLPREFSFVVTAVFLIYITTCPLWESLLLSIVSIPFYIAMPISNNIDAMANWRIIIGALFFKWLLKSPKLQFKIKNFIPSARDKKNRLGLLGILFLIISSISLIGAEDLGVGIKKVLFLANIFLLYILVKNLCNTPEKIKLIIKISGLAIGFTLFIGYLQMISVFFYSLYDFWQYWAGNIITIFYGENLARLLSISNTWFSYYGNGTPPTLRMFSIFPDSHSFAMFDIISVPFLLALMAYYKEKKESKINYLLSDSFLILSLLAIVLSGSRGTWVSAIMGLAGGLLIVGLKEIKASIIGLYILIQKFKIPERQTPYNKLYTGQAYGAGKNQFAIWRTKFKSLFINQRKLVILTIVLFFALFPISSVVLEQSQKAEIKRLNNGGAATDNGATFKRFASVIDITETSNKGRLEIWKDTLNSIKKHPFLGVGFGNFPIVLAQDISAGKKGASAHNVYLDIWAETGILGLIVFLLIFYEIGKTSYKVFKKSNDGVFKIFAGAFEIYLIWIMGYGLFDVVLFNDKVLLMFVTEVGILYGVNSFVENKSEAILDKSMNKDLINF